MRNGAALRNSDLISADVTSDFGDLVEVDQELPERREAFCQHYVTNGFNGSAAARSAGYSELAAGAEACRLLKDANVTRRIATLMSPGLKANKINLENVLAQISAIANFDKRKLYDADGNRIPIHLLDDETAAALSHFTKEDLVAYDKTKALDMAAKYLGVYERDNKQKSGNIAIQIVLEE